MQVKPENVQVFWRGFAALSLITEDTDATAYNDAVDEEYDGRGCISCGAVAKRVLHLAGSEQVRQVCDKSACHAYARADLLTFVQKPHCRLPRYRVWLRYLRQTITTFFRRFSEYEQRKLVRRDPYSVRIRPDE